MVISRTPATETQAETRKTDSASFSVPCVQSERTALSRPHTKTPMQGHRKETVIWLMLSEATADWMEETEISTKSGVTPERIKDPPAYAAFPRRSRKIPAMERTTPPTTAIFARSGMVTSPESVGPCTRSPLAVTS